MLNIFNSVSGWFTEAFAYARYARLCYVDLSVRRLQKYRHCGNSSGISAD